MWPYQGDMSSEMTRLQHRWGKIQIWSDERQVRFDRVNKWCPEAVQSAFIVNCFEVVIRALKYLIWQQQIFIYKMSAAIAASSSPTIITSSWRSVPVNLWELRFGHLMYSCQHLEQFQQPLPLYEQQTKIYWSMLSSDHEQCRWTDAVIMTWPVSGTSESS